MSPTERLLSMRVSGLVEWVARTLPDGPSKAEALRLLWEAEKVAQFALRKGTP
jgi:hypothetical protein